MCVTQMEVDWTVLGGQNTIVRRRCGGGSVQSVSCQSGDTLNLQYKQCTETSRGFGSNDNLEIAYHFSSKNNQDVRKKVIAEFCYSSFCLGMLYMFSQQPTRTRFVQLFCGRQ